MVQIHKGFSLLAVSVAAAGVLAVVPASAMENGPSGRPGQANTAQSQNTTTSTQHSSEVHATSNTATPDTAAGTPGGGPALTNFEEYKKKAEQQLASARQGRQNGKSVQARQKACEARKAGLQQKGASFTRHAEKQSAQLNATYTQMQKYQADNNVAVVDLAALKATIDAQKSATNSAVSALADAATNIDCTSADPAVGVATLKTAVANVRKSLNDYRTALLDLVKAVRTAKPAVTSPDNEETN
ncbi:MAG TPA: hypothetical protein VK978_03320 [Candidatus Saccharimonadales bacterium]|nr:hypothetical protein [Candidatus Saccharimonadales bacterium]